MLSIPAPSAISVAVRFSSLLNRDTFDPLLWPLFDLQPDPAKAGYWQIDLNTLGITDGDYEYEFILDGQVNQPIADPFAEEIVKFGGYRGLFRIRDGKRWRWPFSWDDELAAGQKLPNNNQIVIYEMPLRWMSNASEDIRQISLGSFEAVIFGHLDELATLGVNTIELLPIQDSADTLNWGYGSRFFFTTDYDIGVPIDLKLFVKRCHQRGIRVIMDVVMNHARECPLEQLAFDWFFLRDRNEEPGRGDDYGAKLFRYRQLINGHFPAREFHYQMAEFWVTEFHMDGFRLDEFKGIDNWEFIQTFRQRTSDHFQHLFPDRPFIVIAEDSWCRPEIVQDLSTNPSGHKVVDSMWNFSFRDESRRLLRNAIQTAWGQPSRQDRIRGFISGKNVWDDLKRSFKGGYVDMAQNVNYITSHDVEHEGEERYMNYVFGNLLRSRQLGNGSVENVKAIVDHLSEQSSAIINAHEDALEQVRSGFALLLTSVGIPMFLAGEEFGDIHDLDHTDYRLKMSDPVNWQRLNQPGHGTLKNGVQELIHLRTSSEALQRNELEFFHFHPSIDDNDGIRVFAYCRTGGRLLGTDNQVVVIVNSGPHAFASYDLPWPWTNSNRVKECSSPIKGGIPSFPINENRATLSLAPFQVRVFTT